MHAQPIVKTPLKWPLAVAASVGLLLVCAPALDAAASNPPAASASRVLDVTTFGAKPDGVTISTKAIQQAIDACHEQGGGRVRFTAGEFVSGTILLKDNVTLLLERGAALRGSLDIADYSAPDKFRTGNNVEVGYCFIAAVEVKNVGIEGEGVIDGRGAALLAARPKGNSNRPFLARIVRCDGVTLRGVRLQSSAFWTLHLAQSRNISVTGLSIHSRGVGNNDGIDIDGSQSVRIRDCEIDTGDDAICMKSTSPTPSRDIEISDCRLASHWGGIKFGTESMANFENIQISRCTIREAQGGIKLSSVDGAHLQNVTISDITMDDVSVPLFVRLGARLRTFRAGQAAGSVGSVNHVIVRNVKAKARSPIGILISGIPDHPVQDLTLENIEITVPGGGKAEEAALVLKEEEKAYPEITMFGRQFPVYGMFARHVDGLRIKGLTFALAAPDARPAMSLIDVRNSEINGLTFPENPAADCPVRLEAAHAVAFQGLTSPGKPAAWLTVVGKDNRDIRLQVGANAPTEPVRFTDGADPAVVAISAKR